MNGGAGTGRRLALALAICAIAALILAACGSSTESTESASGESQSKSEAKALAEERAGVLNFGKAGTKAEAEAVAVPLRAFFLDSAHKYWGAACSYLATRMKNRTQQIGGPGDAGCGKGIEALMSAATAEGEGANAAAKKLRRSGNRAFLIYRTESAKIYAMPMVFQRGYWRLDGVNPTLLYY